MAVRGHFRVISGVEPRTAPALLRKEELGAERLTGGKKEKDFAQTTSACLSFIQEALLKHQWQQAAEYMHSYFQILEDSDSYKRQAAPEISLQHALYLLHHGMLDDANRNLSQAETWRYGEKSSSQEVLINLIQAYKGLLQYYTWSKKRMELSKLGEWNHGDWVQEEWNPRRNWWPGFHFSYFWAKRDWKEDKALACEKALVAGILSGKGCRYYRYISKRDHQVLRKKIKRMKKLVKKCSIVNPGL
ncbi:PREDICTED: TATA box-binding protein-associated factor RNA polymerase I subunit A [Hipposideros armiger]|uniref:TATA box-binding protein-associated factor RNA polymerase I subunit A n=1 Tax=Hipposideros armiger TaxID=186990 RepID=A0A8B7R4U1_HIPAR|nr:PREDICTED: TATA box-binding protein-associated factor RNA polymerase I subunit A [Hipposideros armiger]